jgi:hypothetical protein
MNNEIQPSFIKMILYGTVVLIQHKLLEQILTIKLYAIFNFVPHIIRFVTIIT